MTTSKSAIALFVVVLVTIFALSTFAQEYYQYQPLYRVEMTPEQAELHRQGKLDAPGAVIYPNTPLPTDTTTETLCTAQLKAVPSEWDWRLHAKLHSNVLTQVCFQQRPEIKVL